MQPELTLDKKKCKIMQTKTRITIKHEHVKHVFKAVLR